MHKELRSPIFALLLALMLSFGSMLPARATVIVEADRRVSQPGYTSQYAVVQLVGAPLSTYSKTKPAPGKKINFSSSTTKSYRALLAARRNEYKQWLSANAPKAQVTGEYEISLNALTVKLNGTTLATLRASSLVQRVEYQGLYYTTGHEDPDLEIIDAAQAWAKNGSTAATAGQGVKVGIVDSGIDVTHPCFDDAGYPEVAERGDTRFTNNKVIVARVFYNKAQVQGQTAQAIDDHGTHVAGTVACNLHTPAVVDGVDIPYDPSGVAPRALLGNYNVFPGQVASARSEDILNALESAYRDGMDVINMSLGGGASGKQDLLTVAVDNLDVANVVVAVSAGNNGPGYFTLGSPGSAARALTAGASTVPHFVGAPVTVAGKGTFGAASGDFATVKEPLTAPLDAVTDTTTAGVNGLSTACSALPAGSLAGEIALISRGACTFSTKIRNAQTVGAVAVLVANNVAGDPVAMGADGTPNQPTVPAYQVGQNTGKALLDADGAATTISLVLQYFRTENVDIMAGFSSQGPSDVDFRVKPDVVAPGVNVLSSVTANDPVSGDSRNCGATGCWAFFQGTSMAAPHLAGSAAVVRDQHPTWSAAQVRSAIVNTAEQGVLKDYKTGVKTTGATNNPPYAITTATDVLVEGAGRENLDNAVSAVVAIEPVSVSFGATPSGSGTTKRAAVRLTNLSGAAQTFTLGIRDSTGRGVTYSVSPATASLGAGASTTVFVTMSAAKGAGFGPNQATLFVNSGTTEVAHAAVFTFVK